MDDKARIAELEGMVAGLQDAISLCVADHRGTTCLASCESALANTQATADAYTARIREPLEARASVFQKAGKLIDEAAQRLIASVHRHRWDYPDLKKSIEDYDKALRGLEGKETEAWLKAHDARIERRGRALGLREVIKECDKISEFYSDAEDSKDRCVSVGALKVSDYCKANAEKL